MQIVRRHQSTPELDRQELDWRQKFAGAKEKYSRVQTPANLQFLREYFLLSCTPPKLP